MISIALGNGSVLFYHAAFERKHTDWPIDSTSKGSKHPLKNGKILEKLAPE
jgi:hypothetical protein